MTYPREYREGKVEFFGRNFFVDERVLIPRFETENLIRLAKKIISQNKISFLIDIGTGSGIIPITLLHESPLKKAFASDISPDALQIAQKNRSLFYLQNKLSFFEGKFFDPFFHVHFSTQETVTFLVTANLPYIRNDDWEHMSQDTRFEPKQALFGGPKTGFECYEVFFSALQKFIQKRNLEKIIGIIEIGFDQVPCVEALFGKLGWKYNIVPDLCGIPRHVVFTGKR